MSGWYFLVAAMENLQVLSGVTASPFQIPASSLFFLFSSLSAQGTLIAVNMNGHG